MTMNNQMWVTMNNLLTWTISKFFALRFRLYGEYESDMFILFN